MAERQGVALVVEMALEQGLVQGLVQGLALEQVAEAVVLAAAEAVQLLVRTNLLPSSSYGSGSGRTDHPSSGLGSGMLLDL
jgi:hypothetical protein